MKFLAALPVILFCCSMMATPSVGENVVYRITTPQGKTFAKKQEILNFDQKKGLFLVVETSYLSDPPLITNKFLFPENLISDSLINMILARCESAYVNGKIEMISVAAGTFRTCGFTNKKSGLKYNMGHVPFGFVQVSGPDSKLELMSYLNIN